MTIAKYLESYRKFLLIMVHRADLEAWQAEREAVLQILLPACHSGVSPGVHKFAHELLKVMGER